MTGHDDLLTRADDFYDRGTSITTAILLVRDLAAAVRSERAARETADEEMIGLVDELAVARRRLTDLKDEVRRFWAAHDADTTTNEDEDQCSADEWCALGWEFPHTLGEHPVVPAADTATEPIQTVTVCGSTHPGDRTLFCVHPPDHDGGWHRNGPHIWRVPAADTATQDQP